MLIPTVQYLLTSKHSHECVHGDEGMSYAYNCYARDCVGMQSFHIIHADAACPVHSLMNLSNAHRGAISGGV